MKKIYILLSFLICAVASFGQWTIQNIGGPKVLVVSRGPLATDSAMVYRYQFSDTSSANGYNLDQLPGAVIRVDNELWMRSNDTLQWLPIGGQGISTENTNTVTLSILPSFSNPLTADVNISGQPGNIAQSLADGIFVQSPLQNGLQSGGIITWVSGYTYDITQAQYVIGGVTYVAEEDQITLANADPTFDRIDLVVATSSSTFEVIEGTPATDPQNPSYDATTQIPLSFILVTAGSTEPTPPPDQDYIYLNNAEWTTSSSTARINPNSTTNPFSPTKDIEFTAARNNDSITFTDPTQPTDMDNFDVLTMKIRSKATWHNTSQLVFRFFNDGLAVGNSVFVANGTFGYTSSNTTSYQTITIPKQVFGNLSDVDLLFITVVTTGGRTIGLYLDDIQLQDGIQPTVGNFWQLGGNISRQTMVGGTLDNFPVSFITNNTVRGTFAASGQLQLNAGLYLAAVPRLSFNSGLFTSADHYILRTGTTMQHNSTGAFQFLQSGTAQLQLTTNNNLMLGSTASDNATTIFNVASTTKGSHPAPSMTNTQMTNISTPLNGDIVYNTTNTLHYFYNGSTWVPMSTVVTASNGLNISSNDVKLGGTLAANTTIANGNAYQLIVNGSLTGSSIFNVTNSAASGLSSNAIQATATTGRAVTATSTSGTGVEGISTNGVGVVATSTNNGALNATSTNEVAIYAQNETHDYPAINLTSNGATTNTVTSSLDLSKGTSGTAASGFGHYIRYLIESSNGTGFESNKIVSKWTDATTATRTSQISITGVNSASIVTLLTLDGDGTLTLGAEYQGLGAGYLAVSNTGVVSWASATGSMTNPMTTAGDIIYSSDGAGTPARLGIGTSGQILAVSAGGIPEWITASGTGTVTSVGWTGGIVSIATATTTPAFTVAGTSGGVVYFSSGSTWASSAALAANAIVLGGGAGAAPATTTTGTGVVTALGVNVGSAGAFVVNGGALGTPSSGTLTNATGLPLTTGITGTLADDNGGTGQSTYTTGDILYASAANTLSKLGLGSANQVLRVNAGGTQVEWGTLAGTGTVTSVSFTGGLISVATATTTPALTVAGTSGGIPYFSSSSTWASSAALTANALVIGGGAGSAPSVVALGAANRVLGMNTGGTANEYKAITATNGASVTLAANSIVISTVFNPTVQTLVDGATITWNVTNGGNAVVTLGSTGRTLSITNPVAGYTYTVRIIQGSGGSKTITTWPTGTRWPGGTAPTLSTTAGQMDIIVLYYDGSNYYGTSQNAFN